MIQYDSDYLPCRDREGMAAMIWHRRIDVRAVKSVKGKKDADTPALAVRLLDTSSRAEAVGTRPAVKSLE